ncbi:MAG: hypothetical protein V1735_00925 [Nanoarchaeota archaeon]
MDAETRKKAAAKKFWTRFWIIKGIITAIIIALLVIFLLRLRGLAKP